MHRRASGSGPPAKSSMRHRAICGALTSLSSDRCQARVQCSAAWCVRLSPSSVRQHERERRQLRLALHSGLLPILQRRFTKCNATCVEYIEFCCGHCVVVLVLTYQDVRPCLDNLRENPTLDSISASRVKRCNEWYLAMKRVGANGNA